MQRADHRADEPGAGLPQRPGPVRAARQPVDDPLLARTAPAARAATPGSRASSVVDDADRHQQPPSSCSSRASRTRSAIANAPALAAISASGSRTGRPPPWRPAASTAADSMRQASTAMSWVAEQKATNSAHSAMRRHAGGRVGVATGRAARARCRPAPAASSCGAGRARPSAAAAARGRRAAPRGT